MSSYTPSIVIIDRDVDIARAVTRELSSLGIEVANCYTNAKSVKDEVDWSNVSACYVDYQCLTGENDLLAWLHENHSHVVRILATAYSNGVLPRASIGAASVVLRKPFSIHALYGVIISPLSVAVNLDTHAEVEMAGTRWGSDD